VNQQDRSFLTVFTAIMGALVVLAAAIFLVARLVSMVSTYVAVDDSRSSADVEDRIAPVGRVVLADSSEAAAQAEGSGGGAAADAAGMSGEQIVQQVCGACHQAGVMEAPVIGDKAAWEPRYAQGLETLVSHAVNGLNAMPPKGGASNLSEAEIQEAIVWMLAETGFEVEQGSGDTAETEAAAPTEAAPAAESSASAPAEGAEAAPAAAESGATGDLDLAKGEELYGQVCVACHGTGAAGAPILGDKAAWEARIAQGQDTLVQHAVAGFNTMPPKGGAMNLSDEEIAHIVGYMVQQAE
jgi:cytochrome c5